VSPRTNPRSLTGLFASARSREPLSGLIFTFASYLIGLAPVAMAVAIMMLEIFVAFLQAFIFCMLTGVYIGKSLHPDH